MIEHKELKPEAHNRQNQIHNHRIGFVDVAERHFEQMERGTDDNCERNEHHTRNVEHINAVSVEPVNVKAEADEENECVDCHGNERGYEGGEIELFPSHNGECAAQKQVDEQEHKNCDVYNHSYESHNEHADGEENHKSVILEEFSGKIVVRGDELIHILKELLKAYCEQKCPYHVSGEATLKE